MSHYRPVNHGEEDTQTRSILSNHLLEKHGLMYTSPRKSSPRKSLQSLGSIAHLRSLYAGERPSYPAEPQTRQQIEESSSRGLQEYIIEPTIVRTKKEILDTLESAIEEVQNALKKDRTSLSDSMLNAVRRSKDYTTSFCNQDDERELKNLSLDALVSLKDDSSSKEDINAIVLDWISLINRILGLDCKHKDKVKNLITMFENVENEVDQVNLLLDFFNPTPDHPLRINDAFYEHVYDGVYFCLLFNNYIKYTNRSFGRIDKHYLECTRLYQRIQNLTFFKKAVEIRLDVKIEPWDCKLIANKRKEGRKMVEEGILLLTNAVITDLKRDLE